MCTHPIRIAVWYVFLFIGSENGPLIILFDEVVAVLEDWLSLLLRPNFLISLSISTKRHRAFRASGQA